MKKILSLLIVLVLCFTFLPVRVNAEIGGELADNGENIELLYKNAKSNNVQSNNTTAKLTSENGKTIDVDVYEIPQLSTYSNDGNTHTVVCVTALNKSMFDEIKTYSSVTKEDDDGTYVYGKLVCTYTKLKAGSGYQDRYLLTKVNGSWTVKTYQITLSNRRVAYTCQSASNLSATAFKYPSSNTFSYNTGFKKYAEDVYGSWVAAQMNVTCKRGTGSWKFNLYNTIIDRSPKLSDLFS